MPPGSILPYFKVLCFRCRPILIIPQKSVQKKRLIKKNKIGRLLLTMKIFFLKILANTNMSPQRCYYCSRTYIADLVKRRFS